MDIPVTQLDQLVKTTHLCFCVKRSATFLCVSFPPNRLPTTNKNTPKTRDSA